MAVTETRKALVAWRDHVVCRRCGRNYIADYSQDRDWSSCPDCTGEAGKPAARLYDPTRRWEEVTPEEYRARNIKGWVAAEG